MKKLILILAVSSLFAYNAYSASTGTISTLENRTNHIEEILNNAS